MPEIPEYAENWAWATGSRIALHGNTVCPRYTRPRQDDGHYHLVEAPILESPQWRADVMDGLLAHGWTLVACRGKVSTRGNYLRKSGHSVFLSCGPLSDRTDVAGYGQSLNSALNTAVTKAREAQP